jgi:hypothetical protein
MGISMEPLSAAAVFLANHTGPDVEPFLELLQPVNSQPYIVSAPSRYALMVACLQEVWCWLPMGISTELHRSSGPIMPAPSSE